jgi:hypothetical protein
MFCIFNLIIINQEILYLSATAFISYAIFSSSLMQSIDYKLDNLYSSM